MVDSHQAYGGTRRRRPVVPRSARVAVLAIALVTPLLAVPAAAAPTGTARSAASQHAVVASPLASPAAGAITRQRKRAGKLLALVNGARSHARTCGTTSYRAAKPLRYRATLADAARGHARDMARHDYFDHYGRSGSSPSQRAKAAGYRGGTGENIAAGYGSAARTMKAWLASPGHCANIMNRGYKHLGIGYGYAADSTYRDYWVQDFGTG